MSLLALSPTFCAISHVTPSGRLQEIHKEVTAVCDCDREAEEATCLGSRWCPGNTRSMPGTLSWGWKTVTLGVQPDRGFCPTLVYLVKMSNIKKNECIIRKDNWCLWFTSVSPKHIFNKSPALSVPVLEYNMATIRCIQSNSYVLL